MSELEEAMDILAYAATTSNSVLESLTEANKKLTEQLKDAHSLIKKLQDENATLLRIIKTNITGKAPTSPTTPRSLTSPGKNRRRGKIDYEKTDHFMEPAGYCWSCGFQVPKNHTSLNCDSQKPGHQLGTTRENMMNGSRTHHWWNPK
eukprot:1971178-Ditylum_brightwellii.AAC.1